MKAFQRSVQGLTRLLRLTSLVVLALGACANDSAPSAAQAVVDAEAIPDSSDASVAATAWCVDTRIPIGCFHDVPEAPPGRELDTASLVLRLAGYNGDAPLDYPIERVPDSQACTTTGLEWYYRDAADVPLLMLCHNVCSMGTQGGEGLLWIRAACI
jgi:hypothetical protein